MTAPRLLISELSVAYEGASQPALANIYLTVHEGECVMIAGLSGCGKSSLLKAVAGTLPANTQVIGTIDFEKSPCSHSKAIGWIHQNPDTQLFGLTPLEEIKLGLGLAGRIPEDEEALRLLHGMGLGSRCRALNRTLSSGERQLLLTAAVMAGEPSLLLLDEPTTFLDRAAQQRFFEQLTTMKQQGTAIVMVEHNPAALSVADRIVMIEQGVVIEEAPAHPAPPSKSLQRVGLLPTGAAKDRTEAKPQSPPAVEMARVDFAFDQRELLTDISVAFERGLFHVLLGANGCGKTTLLQLIAGYLRPRRGVIRFAGRRVSGRERRRKSFCIFSVPDRQFLTATVNDELHFGSAGEASPADLRQVVEAFDLGGCWDQPIRRLSMGQRQRLLIAVSLLHRREVLLLDEPTVGMDWVHISMMMELLEEWLRRGKTIILATHNTELARRFGDTRRRIEHGKICDEKRGSDEAED